MITKTSSSGSAAGKGLVGMVDARDVGAVAAEIAVSPAPHVGETRWLSGPELISNYYVAEVLSRLLGRVITYRELTFDENKNAMVSAGMPEAIAEQNARAKATQSGSVTTSKQPWAQRPLLRAVRCRPRPGIRVATHRIPFSYFYQ